METSKTVIGFVTLLITVVVFLQSCAASTTRIAEIDVADSSRVGMVVALLLLVAGLEAISSGKNKGRTLFGAVLYVFAGALALTARSVYGYLVLWGVVSLIFALVLFCAVAVYRKEQAADTDDSSSPPTD